ncbi:MAG: Do family serine endopeptidase [Agarilytica sp.]
MKKLGFPFAWCLVVVTFIFGSAHVVARNLPDFTQLIQDKSAAVVKINTEAKGDASKLSLPPGHQVPELFRQFIEPRNTPKRNLHSMGSGFFVSDDGYLITNNHVIEGADEIVVRLTDRREYNATLIGTDPISDLALLKVEEKNLPYLELADGDELKVGEWVVAIGSPFGLDFSASAGIVSAKGRSIPNQEGDYVPFIQTDVAINPGNSGGPLFDLSGKVVGVNSQIYTQSGGSIGLSFAIPSGVARNVVKQLKSKGHVDRGWLGVVIQEVDKDLAQSFGLKKPQGALITRMEIGGPAEKSGLKEGDIITRFDDVEIVDRSDLPHAVGVTAPGARVQVEVMRRGKRKVMTVKVGVRGGDSSGENKLGEHANFSGDRLGLVVAPVDDDNLKLLRLKGGVRVREVDPRGPAAEAGIEPGDILAQLGFEEIKDFDDYQAVMQSLPENTLLPVRFFKRGQPLFRTIILESK